MARQIATQFRAGAGVHRREWLVQQEKTGIGSQRTGERDALRLASREHCRPLVLAGREVHALKPLHRGGARGAPDAARAQPEGDVLEHREVRKEKVVLKDHADRASLGRDSDTRRWVVQEYAVEHDASFGEGDQTGQRPEQRRLARGVRPQQDHDPAALDVKPGA